MTTARADPFDAGVVLSVGTDSLLGAFNRAGVLAPADVHVALRLGRLGGEPDPSVLLAAALAVRAPRVGHVLADLSRVRATVLAESEEMSGPGSESGADLDALPWPDPDGWPERVGASPLVSVGPGGPDDRPLRLVGSSLYLDRYWRDECLVAAELTARAGTGLTVIAGGPGTGKTTTVARLIAELEEQASTGGTRPPLVALAAPTGKAAARMEEAVRAEADRIETSPVVRERLGALSASTLHRLLGRHPGTASRFRHHRGNRLPHDVVVVDESSMVSLWLMARLLEAVRPDARLLLVGDPEQLASVEAGAVLGDIVGPALSGPAAGAGVLADCIVTLDTNHRFTGALADLADAIREGDADRVIEALRSGVPSVEWRDVEVASASEPDLEPVRVAACSFGTGLVEAALAADPGRALTALRRFRILCAHRSGPAGVSTWNPRVEEWLGSEVRGFSADGAWYVGRPVMVGTNDYSLRLFNGDSGVVIARPDGGLMVTFDRAAGPLAVSPSRLADVDTVFSVTVHKAQGSEFDEVAVLLPEPGSRILTRELLYTAITRARSRVVVVGTEESVRAAVERRVARASGLVERLWPGEWARTT